MRYNPANLRDDLKSGRGNYTDLAARMSKYRKVRANPSKKEYNLAPFFKDNHNITIFYLSALMHETGMPITYFIDFEPEELPNETELIASLKEIVRMKDEMLADKDKLITIYENEINNLKAEIGRLKTEK